MILRSNSVQPSPVKPGDLVQVFYKLEKEKRGKWLSPRTVLEIDQNAGIVKVPGSMGRTISAALEDVRIAHEPDDIVKHIFESIDQMDELINYWPDCTSDCVSTKDYDTHHQGCAEDFMENDEPVLPVIGDQVDIFWPLGMEYYPGTVTAISETGQHVISYDDGDTETLTMGDETWRFTPTMTASLIHSLPSLESNEQEALKPIFDFFGNKPFLRHQAQGFDQAVLENAFQSELKSFLETVEQIPWSDVPDGSNIIGSHGIFKMKTNDDGSLKLKARIALHGNEDSQKAEMKTDCCICSPTGIRIVVMVAAFFGWCLNLLDSLTAFLQTGDASRLVYVIPRKEYKDRRFVWLLLVAVYGLVNSNAKWQVQSDQALRDIGLTQSKLIPQLFFKRKRSKLVLIAAKIVDYLMVAGEEDEVKEFERQFGSKFKLGRMNSDPG